MTSFVALDFETADNGRDSACAIGLVRVQDWQIIASSPTPDAVHPYSWHPLGGCR